MRIKLMVVLTSMVFACGCASSGKVLYLACEGCAILQGTGACGVVGGGPAASATADTKAKKAAVPACVSPARPWDVNFKAVIDKGEPPKIECR